MYYVPLLCVKGNGETEQGSEPSCGGKRQAANVVQFMGAKRGLMKLEEISN